MMNLDEKSPKAPDINPTPQESLKEDNAVGVTPLEKESVIVTPKDSTAGVMFILYFLTLIRTIKPFMGKKLRFVFRIVMVVGACIWEIAGPVVATARTKDDRAVSAGLTTLSSAYHAWKNCMNLKTTGYSIY